MSVMPVQVNLELVLDAARAIRKAASSSPASPRPRSPGGGRSRSSSTGSSSSSSSSSASPGTGGTSGDADAVLRAADEMHVRLLPVHPRATDARLVTQFVVEVPDRDAAKRVIDRFKPLSATRAAYLKPPISPP